MKMESVSHCDERSFLAPQRQQIMSILQVTVFHVTTFFLFFFILFTLFTSVTPKTLGNESRGALRSNVHQELWWWGIAAKRRNRIAPGCCFLCLESLQQSFSLSPLRQIVTLCLQTWRNDCIHSAGCTSRQIERRRLRLTGRWLRSRAVRRVDEVCCCAPPAEMFISKT